MKQAFRFAFPYTVPILLGYGFMGIAFGISLSQMGYSFLWATIMAVTIYGGSMQFVALGLLRAGFDPVACAILTITVNCRYMFYGISMLKRYRSFRLAKLYMIHTLTDETYSIQCSIKIPEDLSEKKVRLLIAGLNQLYWIAGCTIGGLVGGMLAFDTAGIDFTMTALYVVIAVEQWESVSHHIPALLGFLIPVVCLFIFGSKYFVMVSMVGIIIGLFVFRKHIERGMSHETALQ